MSAIVTSRHRFARAEVVAWLLSPLLILLGHAAAAQNATFGCSNGKSYLFKSNPTDIYEIDLSTATTTPKTSGGIPIINSDGTTSASRLQLNAFGYNSKDNFIWGQVYNTSQLVRVGSDYKGKLYSVANLPSNPYVVGDVSPKTGIMYLAIGGSNATDQIYTIDLTKPTLTAVPLTTTLSFITDWAVSPIDGNLYALYSSLTGKPTGLTLYRFLTADRTNADGSITKAGTREVLGEVTGGSPAISANNFGSAFMDFNGSFYVVVNSTEATYRIDSPDKLGVNGKPTATYIATPPNVPNDTNTDGARCALSNVSALPVTLTSFTAAAAASRSVQLTWTTANELNNDYFEVQHSADGQAFEAVGRVAGHLTTTQASAYSFVHAAPGAATTHYYRLRQVDLDGTSTYSPVRTAALGTGATQWQLAVAPNPTTSDNLRVQVQLEAAAATAAVLEVRGPLGQCVLRQPVALQPGSNQLALSSHLQPGVYWLSLVGDAAMGTKGAKVLLTE